MSALKILNVAGCRPNFIKIAPLMAQLKQFPEIRPILVHAGQHYYDAMSDVFFRDLEIPAPDICLNVGSARGNEFRANLLCRERDDRHAVSRFGFQTNCLGDLRERRED